MFCYLKERQNGIEVIFQISNVCSSLEMVKKKIKKGMSFGQNFNRRTLDLITCLNGPRKRLRTDQECMFHSI